MKTSFEIEGIKLVVDVDGGKRPTRVSLPVYLPRDAENQPIARLSVASAVEPLVIEAGAGRWATEWALEPGEKATFHGREPDGGGRAVWRLMAKVRAGAGPS